MQQSRHIEPSTQPVRITEIAIRLGKRAISFISKNLVQECRYNLIGGEEQITSRIADDRLGADDSA